MINQRTKQQIACDGVKMEWHSDAFTEILHRQVTNHFSLDGVIPATPNVNREQMGKYKRFIEAEERMRKAKEATQKPLGNLVGVMDGIRIPWKRAYKTA